MEAQPGRSPRFVLAAIFLVAISAMATGLAWYLRSDRPPPSEPSRPDVPAKLFHEWPRPDFALVLSGEQHGYLLPCGCSRPQVGGLERRYNLLTRLTKAKWHTIPVDLGDIPQLKGPRNLPNAQGMLKYKTSMRALKEMKYQGVGIGSHETAFQLLNTLAEHRLNDDAIPTVSANLKEKDTTFLSLVDSLTVHKVPGSGELVGITSLIGPSVAKAIKDKDVKLDSNGKVLPQLAKALKQKGTRLNVLLYQGQVREAAALAKDFPQFQVILCLSEESEPPAQPTKVGSTMIITVGHKGRYVGVIGAYRTGRADEPYKLRYQLVSLSEDFMTPKGVKNPVLDLMEEYTRTLKNERYLSRYNKNKHPHQVAVPGVVPKYVGSETCRKCHRSEHKVWKASKHSHAYEALLTAEKPGLRQYDAECIVCHTVGFGYESGFTSATETPQLKGVGCESCHGPGSEHIKNKYDEKWHKLMNPWRLAEDATELEKQQMKLRIDRFCQQCHDIDNDVHWKFEKRWPPVKH